MNPLWLLIICPASAAVGAVLMACLVVAKRADECCAVGDDEETVAHCNLKENAELIASILDCDASGEVYTGLPNCGAGMVNEND